MEKKVESQIENDEIGSQLDYLPKEYTLGQLAHYSKSVELIESSDIIGAGTEVDPKRSLIKFWLKDGRLLTMLDPLKEYQEHQKKIAERNGNGL